ncbi:MAG: hypothetical protein FJ303_14750 [Planctomycetes bacterium]|nr:hypothetical protein [Planctomycetota bacterium]
MKGPRSRHRFNVWRVWECPKCKKRVFAPPQVVTHACTCQGADNPTWMCLIDPERPKRPPPTAAPQAATP